MLIVFCEYKKNCSKLWSYMSLHGSLKNYEKKALFQLERKTVKIVINRWKQRFLSFIRLLWL